MCKIYVHNMVHIYMIIIFPQNIRDINRNIQKILKYINKKILNYILMNIRRNHNFFIYVHELLSK